MRSGVCSVCVCVFFLTSDSLVLSEFLYGVRLSLCFLCNVCMLRNEVILNSPDFSRVVWSIINMVDYYYFFFAFGCSL